MAASWNGNQTVVTKTQKERSQSYAQYPHRGYGIAQSEAKGVCPQKQDKRKRMSDGSPAAPSYTPLVAAQNDLLNGASLQGITHFRLNTEERLLSTMMKRG